MLYITTRGDRDAFTAHRTLCTNTAPDSGYFIPTQFPRLSIEELSSLMELSFEAIIAHILNLFFAAGLTKWDVNLCVGRNTARVWEMNPRIWLGELWHNPGNSFEYVVCGLFQRVYGEESEQKPTEWFRITVKMAVLFGLYSELCRNSVLICGERIDLSIPSDDLSYPVAILYASAVGLPVGNVVCNCVHTHEVWNLIHRGTLNVSAIPDSLKAGIERFLILRLNRNPMTCMQGKRSFDAKPEEKTRLKKGMFCVVSGTDRVFQAINGTYRGAGQLISPDAALCMTGLGDYRAKTGEIRTTLILEADSPALFPEQIESATGIPKQKIGEYLGE